jgi:hypothetical protein
MHVLGEVEHTARLDFCKRRPWVRQSDLLGRIQEPLERCHKGI